MPEKQSVFDLTYQDFLIGVLTFSGDIWTFEYSEKFKEDKEFNSILGFPQKDKIYYSNKLFPFFAARIPSTKRSDIIPILEAEGIDKNDTVTLLERFGHSCITNPFKLTKI